MILFTFASFLALSTVAESKEVVNRTETRKKVKIERASYVKPKKLKDNLDVNDTIPFKLDLMLDGKIDVERKFESIGVHPKYYYPFSLGLRTSYTFFDCLTLGIGESYSNDLLGLLANHLFSNKSFSVTVVPHKRGIHILSSGSLFLSGKVAFGNSHSFDPRLSFDTKVLCSEIKSNYFTSKNLLLYSLGVGLVLPLNFVWHPTNSLELGYKLQAKVSFSGSEMDVHGCFVGGYTDFNLRTLMGEEMWFSLILNVESLARVASDTRNHTLSGLDMVFEFRFFQQLSLMLEMGSNIKISTDFKIPNSRAGVYLGLGLKYSPF